MYHKHTTEGIVIKGRDRGEGNKVVSIFSKEFGLIYATVQNGRSQTSKHRSHIEDYTLGNFSLVRGKHGWKLVGAEAKQNPYFDSNSVSKITLARVLLLLSKLSGEEYNPELYGVINEFLKHGEELKTVLYMLQKLGYVKETAEQIEELTKNPKMATAVINASLKAAGLV